MLSSSWVVFALSFVAAVAAGCQYCDLLGKDDVQGLKSGFMAGNKVYYIGGRYTVWKDFEDETIGLTHPFFHDLRSRGDSIAYYKGMGTGNDFSGWKFYANTKVLYGTVILKSGERVQNPVPKHMYWQPDKMIVEYDVNGVNIREEKFVASNDVISTIIWSDQPITLEFAGQSFVPKTASWKDFSLNAKCAFHTGVNSIQILEGGNVTAQVGQKPNVYVDGKMMYDGMSTILTASRPLDNVKFGQPVADKSGTAVAGACNYVFQVPVDSSNTTVSWTMNDEWKSAVSAVQAVLTNPMKYLEAKTEKMNHVLENVVPYFDCSDKDVVKVYYFLWSIFMMYYTQGDAGTMQEFPHTQTAVNNFLGMHRYDANFQIRVGSWANPAEHDFYANGNVLAWSKTLPYKNDKGEIPANFGTTWATANYGTQAIGHVFGAWQIYEHSGNTTFLAKAYDFYKALLWDNIPGFWGAQYDGVICLKKMAEALGHHADVDHWDQLVDTDTAAVVAQLNKSWEKVTPNWFTVGSGKTMGLSDLAYTTMSQFPRDWVVKIAEHWLDNSVEGFNSDVPLARYAIKDWPKALAKNPNFAVTPDGNWFVLHGLYLHNVDGLANKFTVAHLKKYNMENGVPVAPETRRKDFTLCGDQFSNFNAGKILNIIEGIGGIRYSVTNDSFTFADNLPTDWSYMEYHIPVMKGSDVTWVKTRAERVQKGHKVTKSVTVDLNPFKNLNVEPWAEDAEVTSASPADTVSHPAPGHVGWRFQSSKASVVLKLSAKPAPPTPPTPPPTPTPAPPPTPPPTPPAPKPTPPVPTPTPSGAEEVDDGGWCKQWKKLDEDSKPKATSAEECWQQCREREDCMQANYESAGQYGIQCFLGGQNMTLRPTTSRSCDSCVDHCYAKYGFGSVEAFV